MGQAVDKLVRWLLLLAVAGPQSEPSKKRKREKGGFMLFVCWDDSHEKAGSSLSSFKIRLLVCVVCLFVCLYILLHSYICIRLSFAFVVDEIANRVSLSFSARSTTKVSLKWRV
jgi:hypothetical protein